MPLFSKSALGRTKSGLMQAVFCPRCKEELDGEQEFTSGEGVGIRKVVNKFTCPCGYSIECTERYPIINRARDNERHIP